jgi:MYXO-CTERM domain-containing protein
VKVEIKSHCYCGVARTGSSSDLLAAFGALGGLGMIATLRRRKRRATRH